MQRHKKLSARILSMVLSVAMVCTMLPATVFAAEGDIPLGASSVTECHPAHDEDCGYLEAVEAVEGIPCTHECEQCKVVDSGNALPGVMPRAGYYCICMVQCSGPVTSGCRFCESMGVHAGSVCKPRGLVIDDVTVSGVVGKELVGGITTTLTTWGEGSKFVRSAGTEDVTNWFTGLPAGITVEATFDEAHDSYITLTFRGTPTEQSTAAMSITIPGDSTSNFIDPFGANYQSVSNANAKFNIEANPLAHNLSTDGALELNIDFEQIGSGAIVCNKGCSETNPHIVTSNGQTSNTITLVGASHYVVLNNVNISSAYSSPISIEKDTAFLDLTLKGTNTLTATGDGKAGVYIRNGGNRSHGLFINGEKTDSLTVQGGKGAAGIGGNENYPPCGNITINGGVINATGGESGAGIGSGTNYSDGRDVFITINDGTITATGGGNGAAGIGLSDHSGGPTGLHTTTITGGNVTAIGTGASAYGYGSAPGIGSLNQVINIAVEGGIVNAQGDGSAFNIGTSEIGIFTLTDTTAKYKVSGGSYTGATNISNGKLYEGATGTDTVAKDIKAMPLYKGTEAANVSGTPTAKADTTITLAVVTAPTDEIIEYAYSTTSTAPTAGWQTGTAFTGLTAGTQYYFFARVKATDKHWEGAASTGTAITTNTSGGGSSSGGGGSTPPAKPTEPVSGTSNTTANVDNNGNATTTVTDKNITDAVKAAKDAANKKGVNAGEVTAVINVTSPANSNPNTVTVNLPKTVQQQVINNKIDNVAIVIDKPDISIGMNLATIKEMDKQANGDIQLSATRTDATKLSTEAKNAIGNRPAFDLKATYNSGAKSITSFGSGSVSVAIPYTLQSGEVAGGLYAVYIDGNGKANYITGSSYDANAKMLRFATNHFSVYGIGYKAPVGFMDIADHWAKTDIEFVANRGLMSGTSNTTFAPNGSMTRGMFVTALGRLAGVDTNSYKTGKFTDVKTDAYYAPYVNWAAEKGITSGTTATTFSPDSTVTRQEMAVFMSNYAKAMGYKVPETRDAVTFADNDSIESFAAAAVEQMQMAGVLSGKAENRFDPTGTATRAEVAAVLHRYVELVIDRSTAQGD